MFKTKQKISSVIVACLTMFVSALLGVSALIMPSASNITASAATTEIVFELGANGSASHKDGSSAKTTYTETVGDYTLNLTNGNKMYPSSYDAKGNSCIKLGSSSAVGEFSFTVPNEVSSVIIAVAKYKTNTTKITVNGTSSTLTKNSNDGEYDAITVDTSSTKEVSFTTVSGGVRAMVNTITYVIESDEPACTHGNGTSIKYDSAAKEHYEICVDCEAEIENTRAACSEFTYGEYTTEDGVHTRMATCTVCSGEQTESGTCEVSAEYVREGDAHTQMGTCSICNASTSVTENCTLSYENVSNDDGTHNMTSTCSVCEQSVTTENVDCTFEESLDGTTLTYTCEYCGYSYTEEATTYTVEYVVPEGIEAVASESVADGYTTTLPKAGTVEGYTFVGWVTEELEKTENAPEYFAANTEYEVTEDTTLYALYSYAEGTGAFTLVTDATTLEAGKEIVIVASGSNYAMGADKGNNRNAVTVTKSGDMVTIDDTVQIITLETGNVEETFAFNVGNGYLYAASSSSNYLKTKSTLDNNGSWLITIDSDGVATIKAQGTYTRNWLRKNSSSALFACYSSGQDDVSIYMKDGATYYVTEFNTCAHENVDEVVEEATCTESGSRTVTCLDCESEIEAEILPALGHNFIDGICDNCGKADPASIIYDGYYYLILNNKYLDTTTLDSGDRYKPVDFTPGETIEYQYVFYFVKDGDVYTMYDMSNGLYMENVTITTNNDYSVNIYNSEGNILSHNTSANYVGFYKTTNSYPRDFTFVEVDAPANIDSASITIGADLTLNYYVTMSSAFEGAKMYFTVDGVTYDVAGVLAGKSYKFSLNLPPHYMTTNVKAVLMFNEVELDIMENYSIRTYADNQLNNSPSDALKQLLIDLLYYGAAAQNYKNYKTENLANAGIENTNEAAPTTTDFTLVKNEATDSYPAYFQGAGVYFDNVNKIFVKLSTTENVTLTINGAEVEITGTTIYTDGILATGFDTTYTFVLSYDGVVMQTLTYSVNAYAYAKQNDATMGELALALYRYGESAKVYKA